CDNDGLCDDALVTIGILPPEPVPPVAEDDSGTTDQNTPITVDVLANDSDPDGFLVPGTVSITVNPTNGTITGINSSTGEIEYTPNTDFTGIDTFEYQVCDNDGLCDTALVTINIQPGVTIIAHKIVCTDEADLPNWGDHGPDITLSTAPDFVASHDNCQLTSDWNFQWGQEGVTNPGDNTGEAGSPWHTFGPTNLAGVTQVNIPASQVGARVWIREVWQDGYIEFTGVGTTQDVSAEMYCHQDVLNYDNFDFINNLELGETYYCVAFNVGEVELLPPVANDDSATTPYETPVDIDILANDFDPDGTLVPSTVAILTNPTNGTITGVNPTTGVVSYQPNSGYSGIDTFTYEVCDNDGLCDDALVTIVIEPRELIPPIAEDDAETTDQEIPVDIDVLANDSDPDGTLVPGTVHITSNPANGTITNINALNGVITYQPNPGFAGIDTFEYEVCDNDGLCDTAIVTITVQEGITINAYKIVCDNEGDLPNWGAGGPNITASTAADFVAAHQDCGFATDWSFQWGPEGSSNPGDNTGEAGSLNTFGPTNVFGLAQVSLAASEVTNRIWLREVWQDGFIEFTGVGTTQDVSAEMYCHDDVVNYDNWDFINNVQLGQAYYCVAFNVGEVPLEPPVAIDDSATTNENTPVDIDILVNDFDVDGVLVPPPTITTNPLNGTITNINGTTGVITYTPNSGFSGVDQFEYEICDNDGLCDTALVTVTIEPVIVLLPPTANNDSATTDLNTPVTIDVLVNDSDPDGVLVPSTVQIVSFPSNGNIDSINPTTGEITYTPDLGFSGLDVFEYLVCDNNGLCDTAFVFVDVLPPEPIPPVANDDAAVTDQDTPVDISALDNDSDSDGFLVPSTVEIITPPTNGTITNINSTTGVITYTPNSGYSGLDTFVYRVCDNDGLCDTATVTIAINELAPPVANDDNSTTLINTPVVIPIPDNDFDVDGTLDLSTITVITPPTNGTITNINLLNGDVSYTPNTGFVGTDTFVYEICDNDGLCDTATVTITITTPPTVTPNPPLVVPPAAPAAAVVVANPVIPTPAPAAPGQLIFGANEFVLAAQAQPLARNGIIQASINQPQTFYLEAIGATSANLVNVTTNEVIPMTFDPDLKLWTTSFLLDQTGTFEFEGQIANVGGSYTRQINSVVVSDLSSVTDQQTNQPVTSLVTIYEQDPDTGNFEVWNGEAFAQQNPFQTDGQYSLILPRGEFYLRVDAPGYNSVTSLITEINDQSIVSADTQLIPTGNIFAQFASLFSTTDQSSNFSLNPTPLPNFDLLPPGEVVPDVLVKTNTRAEFNLFDDLDPTKPAILMVYSKWNTLAQEQVDIFQSLASQLGDNIEFVPLTTMEPDNLNLVYLLRGQYGLEMYKPNSQFFDDYFITSLPEFFFLNENRELVDRIVGPQSESSLETQINNIFSQ
ncbi:tandem-95 repeat protein, partial [Candidatus Berkelbacteria bacterium]|nr:tandem-95 repeat protein [Candidatus Berkelbacteria bacterium]